MTKRPSKRPSKKSSKIRQKRMKYKPDFYVAPPVFIKIN